MPWTLIENRTMRACCITFASVESDSACHSMKSTRPPKLLGFGAQRLDFRFVHGAFLSSTRREETQRDDRAAANRRTNLQRAAERVRHGSEANESRIVLVDLGGRAHFEAYRAPRAIGLRAVEHLDVYGPRSADGAERGLEQRLHQAAKERAFGGDDGSAVRGNAR